MGGVAVGPLGPNLISKWEHFDAILAMKYDSLIPKTHFIPLLGVSKCICYALYSFLRIRYTALRPIQPLWSA